MTMLATLLTLGALALGQAPQNPDEAAVRLVVQRYVDAREARDPEGLRKVFTSDADQLVSSGEWRKGRDAVVKGGLASSQQTGGRRALLVDSVRFLAPSVALVDARYELTGLEGGTSRSMRATLILVRDTSDWRVTAIRNMLPAAPVPERAAAGASDLLFLDRAHLARARSPRTAGDAATAAALAALEEDATKALALPLLSVMDKGVTPPSGDKHDYMSQAPYWWPDPAKADGRPYMRKDGERNPEISRISDHANFDRVISAVSTLGLAFHLTGRTDYARHGCRLVKAWFLDPATRMNPHLRYGQGIPGITEGRGIGIIETRALPQLLDGVTLLAESPVWTESDAAQFRAWMRAYLTWLVESPHGKEEAKNGNNHETWYDVQVASLALFTGRTDLARRTLERSQQRIATQIEPDGRQPRELERTRSWDYSIFNLRAFFDLATLGDTVGVDLWNHRTADGRGLRPALDFLVPSAAGERPWTHAQITPFRPGELSSVLRRAARTWKEPTYQALADRIGGTSPRAALTAP